MEKRVAAGAVIYRVDEGENRFLLVYSERNQIWGFPKGHLDEGETEMDAARREIREEVGITELNFNEAFRAETDYEIERDGERYLKVAVYFLAETPTAEVNVDGEEITQYQWLNLEEALELLPFEALGQILKKADELAG